MSVFIMITRHACVPRMNAHLDVRAGTGVHFENQNTALRTVLVLIKSHTLETSFLPRFSRSRVVTRRRAAREWCAARGTGAGCRVSRTYACLASSRHVESCKQSAEDRDGR